MLFEKFVPDCIRSNLRGSKFKIFLGGACPQTSLVGTHAYLRVSVLSDTTIILLPSCFSPQLKILYETLEEMRKSFLLAHQLLSNIQKLPTVFTNDIMVYIDNNYVWKCTLFI